MGNKSSFVFLSICVGILAACSGKKSAKTEVKKLPIPSVDIMLAATGNINQDIEANGTVLAGEESELHAEMSGKLVFLYMPDGVTVSAGTILARINDAELQGQLRQQRAELDLATKNEQRLKKLLEINGINMADYDAAKAKVETYRAGIDILNAQIEKYCVRAPFTGQLGLRKVSPGAYVTPTMVLGSIQQTQSVKADFTLPDIYASLITTGSKIDLLADNGKTSLKGIVIATENKISENTRNLGVRVQIIDGKPKPGSFIVAKISRTIHGIMVPTSAIIPEASSNKIFVLKGGLANLIPVQTGARTPEIVEITDGLKEGDSILVTGVLFVRPKSAVKVKSTRIGIKE